MSIRHGHFVISVWLGLALPLAADAATIDLGSPAASSFSSTSVGTVPDDDRSVVFDALSSFRITSAGIRFDPLAGGATTLAVSIFASGLDDSLANPFAGHGTLLATASIGIVDVGMGFYDVPIAFEFAAGSRYDVAFRPLDAAGWSGGINRMEFYNFNFGNPGGPYTVGPVLVVDGACHGTLSNCTGYSNFVMPHVQLNVVPEPASLTLVGIAALSLAARHRQRRRVE